jgi:hypothetical protein
MIGIAGLLLGSGACIASGTTAQGPAQMMSQAQAYSAQRSQIDQAFDDSFGAVRQEQAEIAIALEAEEISVRVQSLEGKLGAIYTKVFSSSASSIIRARHQLER